MRRFSPFLFSLSLTCFFSTFNAWADPCSLQVALQHMFKVEAKKGELVNLKKIESLLPYSKLEYSAELLGSGAGGDVYRITPKHFPKKTFIAKITDLDTALNDYTGFEMLQKAVGGADREVKIAGHKILPLRNVPENSILVPAVMQMEDIHGRSLFSMFADPAVPKSVKQALEIKYNQFLRRAETRLKELYDIPAVRIHSNSEFYQAEKEWNHLGKAAIESQPDIAMWSISVNKLFDHFEGDAALYKKIMSISGGRSQVWFSAEKDIQIILKSDNILVTPKYDLYLIDPH